MTLSAPLRDRGELRDPNDPTRLDVKLLKELGALWQFEGEPREGAVHAVLTSGKHSDTFLNMSIVGTTPGVLTDIIATHIDELQPTEHRPAPDDYVIGSAMGGIVVAYALATVLGCRCAYAEKEQTAEGEESMVLKRFKLPVGTRVLLCEDVVTTGGTTVKTARAVRSQGATLIPYLAAIVNRSGRKNLLIDFEADDSSLELAAAFELTANEWEPDDCPICKAGGKPLRPKQHWHRFVHQG